MIRGILAVVVVTSMAAAGTASADKVTDSIERAQKAYSAGKLSTAARQLQLGVARIRRALAKEYEKTLPPAPDGWTARKSRSRRQTFGMMGGGVTVTKRYRPSSGSGSATAQMIIDSPLLATMGAIYGNPAMAQNAGYEPFEIDGLNQPAFIKFDEDRKRGEVVILIAGRIFLKVQVTRVADEDALKALGKGWNIKRIKEIAEIP